MSALDTTSIWREALVVNPDQQLGRPTSVRSVALLLGALATPLVLLGCSAFDPTSSASARQHVEEVATVIEEPATPSSADFSVLQIDAALPFTGLAVLHPPPPQIPQQWSATDAISLSLAGTLGDQVVASLIEAATGVRVRFVELRPIEAPDDPFGLPAAALPEGGIWTGPLDELLDMWTATRGYAWRWEPETESVSVTRSQAVAFTLNALAGTQTVSGTTSTTESAGEGGSTNLASQSMATSANYDPWAEVTQQLTAVLDASASIAPAPSTASLTVSGLPRDVARYHYLGYKALVGAQMRYAVHARSGWPIAMLGFSTATWKLAPRDSLVGWTPEKWEKNLHLVVDNPRFLIPPWIEIPDLGSHILALVRRRLPTDWTERYGTTPVLIETFVETPRYTGAVYRASGWTRVGTTQGRGR